MSEWWQIRSPRERLLLQAMLGLAAFVLGWLLVVRPLGDALEAAKARHGAAVVALAEAKARQEAGRSAGAPPPLPIDSLIGASASEAGFTGARITAAGPARASVAIDSARPQALFGWVAALERRGLAVERLRAQANADRTLAAEVSFRARGS
ncbi:MAG TPA: type II secretion system protein GspM [Allosphingosinicella sp.]|nr:type II secretion system protein GspM [Allosphingosinicella sp.]